MSYLLFNNTTVPSTPASGKNYIYVLSSDQMVKMIDSTGTITPLNNHTISSIVTGSSGIADTDTKIGSGLLCTLNTLTAGSLIRFIVTGTCTGAATPGASIFTVRYGSANTVADTAVCTFTLGTGASSGTNISFRVVIDVTIRTIGGSGTVWGNLALINQGTTGLSTTATQSVEIGGTKAIATNATGYIGLSFKSGGVGTTATFQNVITELIRQ